MHGRHVSIGYDRRNTSAAARQLDAMALATISQRAVNQLLIGSLGY
jgi:hypothetical protein